MELVSIGIIVGAVVFIVLFLASMYRIVPAGEAHYIVSLEKTMVCTPDDSLRQQLPSNIKGSRWYFHIPVLRTIKKMDLSIKELILNQETYEKDQARYNVKSSIKYRIKSVMRAAETFTDNKELQEQLKEVVAASVRAITVKYDVVEARANKKKMGDEIQQEMSDDLQKWGLELINFQLIDFQDTQDSKIISNISRRREVEIETRTREENAEKEKIARIKEAQAEEDAKTKEIKKEMIIAQRQQDKDKEVADREKIAQEAAYEVIRVKTIQQANIDREKAVVDANAKREAEEVYKLQKQLEGEGDKLRQIEIAKGEAAPIREKGFAEAEAKEKLQEALNKFGDKAIRALVAEKIVEMQKEIGIEAAKALASADFKVFAGGGNSSGFDLGSIIESMRVADSTSADATLNRIARPNDLGLSALALQKAMNDNKKNDEKEPEEVKENGSIRSSGKSRPQNSTKK